ncbi:KRAB-A domain-containing protein 2-like [Palaemon carinicauda]|uniref:KRAB-A domain-containing protein 2-like n=1 Tax=Palaemon carinicauda TaxID=392227 RepID=UPI0035B62B07
MSDFKEQFEQKLDNLLQSKNDNVVIPRKEKRAQWIAQLLRIEKEGPKTSYDYNMKNIFEILRLGDDDRLIWKRKGLETEFKFIVCFEEGHQAISVAHSAVGHGGEKKTFKGQKKWSNLTMQCCQMLISFCIECQEKKKRRIHKGLLVKPVRSETIFS